MNERLQSIRGAISVEENTAAAISEATTKLIKEIIEKNNLKHNNIVNIMFTMTDDLDELNPATAIRDTLNINNIPLLCSQEMKVKGLIPQVIRTMIQVYTSLQKEEIKHIYLDRAEVLRPDLSKVDK